MSPATPEAEPPVRRIDRILAFMSLGFVVLAVVCFFTIVVAPAIAPQDYASGLWPVILVLVYVAPILAFLLLLTVIIMAFVRRSRANKAQ